MITVPAVQAESASKPRNFTRWLSTTNHKDIGLMYLTLGSLFFLSAG